MVPNAALALLLLGCVGALEWREGLGRWRRILSRLVGVLVTLAAALTLGEYILDRSFELDQLVLKIDWPGPNPGRASLPAALGLLLAGIALVVFDASPTRKVRPAELALLTTNFIALVSLVAHAHGVGEVFRFAGRPMIGIALPTALALFLVSSGLLLQRPTSGLMGLATSSGPGGVLLRRLGLTIAVASPVLGLLAAALLARAEVTEVSHALALLTMVVVPFGLLVVYLTATKIEASRHAIERSEFRLRELLAQASDGIFIADLDGRYTEVNRAGCQLLGLARDEIIGKTIVDFLPPEDVARLWQSRQAMLAGSTDVSEWRVRHGDGSFVPVEVSAKILADGRWQGFVRDIGARKALEQEAARSRARLEGIVSISSDAIISIDAGQRIVLYNDGAKAIFGWSPDEVLGQPLNVLLPERVRARHHEHVKSFALEADAARKMERPGIVGLRKNGEEFPAEASISKIRIDGTQYFNVVLRDQTARVTLEENLRDAIRARDVVTSIVAHDLRSPIGAALLAAETLLMAKPDPDRGSSLVRMSSERIKRSLGRAVRLIDDLLDVARIEAGRYKVDPQPIAPETLVAEAVEGLGPTLAQAELALDVDVDADLPLVRADSARIAQVFSNLLSNAEKFVPAGGHVQVQARPAHGAVRFSVADDGPGIAPEHLAHIFDRFWQVQDSSHRGAGLGLAIAKGIVDAHGGSMGVDSRLGEGSTFWFALPLAPHLPAPGPTAHAAASLVDRGSGPAPKTDAPGVAVDELRMRVVADPAHAK